MWWLDSHTLYKVLPLGFLVDARNLAPCRVITMLLTIFPTLYFVNKRVFQYFSERVVFPSPTNSSPPRALRREVQGSSPLVPESRLTELGVPGYTWVSGPGETGWCLRASQLSTARWFRNKTWKVISLASPFTDTHFASTLLMCHVAPQHPAPHTKPTHLTCSLLRQCH